MIKNYIYAIYNCLNKIIVYFSNQVKSQKKLLPNTHVNTLIKFKQQQFKLNNI